MYRLLLIFIYALSLLPFWVLYLISDLAYVLIYKVFAYRKSVVKDQLKAAFPEKTPEERGQIMRVFYRHFCDQWIETLKLMSIPRDKLLARIHGNWEILEKIRESGENVCIIMGHQFNWEWTNLALQLHSRQDFAAVYLPLESTLFDRLMLKIRQRGGGHMISMKSSRSGFSWIQGRQHILGLIADQNPSQLDQAYWISFMGRSAPFFKGAETLGRRRGTRVLFTEVKKQSRGHYRVHMEILEEPESGWGEPGNLTRQYVRRLERSIQEQPENWMWTHRRWKHSPPTNKNLV